MKSGWPVGQNAVAETFPQPYPALTREYILKLNPDVLLGGSFEKLDSTFFKNYPELRRIKAYQNRRVFRHHRQPDGAARPPRGGIGAGAAGTG